MISVIISTYQRSKQLKKCIKSVMDQTYKDIEIIVVDDYSNDDTEFTVKKLQKQDNRIKYYKLKENHGHDGYPKNYGVSKSNGDFITFIDDDDYYRPEALAILYKYINHTKADVVYGDYMNHLEDGSKQAGWSLAFNGANLQQQNFIAMSTVIINKKKFIEVGGFDEDIPKFKDWNLWIRMFKNGCTFLHIPIFVTDVVQGKGISTDVKIEYAPNGRMLPTFFNPADCLIYPEKTCLGPAKPLKVAIFTLTMDRLEYTKRMYKGLMLAGYGFDWFVVDQASTDGTVEWLESTDLAKVLRCKENVGIASGWIAAIKQISDAGDYDIVIKIDNDAELITEDWLVSIVELYKRNKKMILSPYVEGLEGTPGGVLRQRPDAGMPYMMINDTVMGYVPNLGGIFFASPIELYDGFMFPPKMPGNKDLFLSKFAVRMGYSLFYIEELRVIHMDGTIKQRDKFPEYFERESYG